MLIDEYVFLKKLGEGAFATVWAARKRHGDDQRRLYAVKHLKQRDEPGSGKSLLTTPEFRSLKAIARHPNILRAVQVARERGRVFLVTEFCESNLLKLIEEARERGMRSLPEHAVACAMRHLLEGLAHCHKSAWTHRDVKPENILVRDGIAKIADFGEAAEFNSEETRQTYCGTRWYRAPEQFILNNPAAVSSGYRLSAATHPGAADVWAAGCVMAECYLGHALFRGAADADMLQKIAEMIGDSDGGGFGGAGDPRGVQPVPREMARAWGVAAMTDHDAGGGGGAPSGPGRLRETLKGAASDSGLSLLYQLLCVDPERRITAKQALQHPFLSGSEVAGGKVKLPRSSVGGGGFGFGGGGGGGGGWRGGGGGGGFQLPKKAAHRAAMLHRRRMDDSDSSDDEFDFDAKPKFAAAPTQSSSGRPGNNFESGGGSGGGAAGGVAWAGPEGHAIDIPQHPTAEAEAAMGEIRKQMEQDAREAAAVAAGGGGAERQWA